MFNVFKKKPNTGETITLKLSGLHCAACSLNIDDALEETPGVISSSTNYARQESVINFDPAKVNVDKLKQVIESLDYSVVSTKA